MPKDFPVSFDWFRQTTRKYSAYVFELAAISIIVRILTLVNPFVFQALIDRVIPYQRDASLYIIIFILIIATIFQIILKSLSSYISSDLVNKLTEEFSRRTYHHVIHLPMKSLEKWTTGEIFARMGEIESIRRFLTSAVSSIAIDIIFSLVYILVIYSISPKLTLIIAIILPLQMAATAIIGPALRKKLKKSFQARSLHQSRMIETFENTETIKSQANENHFLIRLQTTLKKSTEIGFEVSKLNIFNGIINESFSKFTNVFIIYSGSILVFTSEITLGQLISFYLIYGNMTPSILKITNLYEYWQGLTLSRLRLGDILNSPTEEGFGKQNLLLEGPATLTLNRVTFSYLEGRPIFENLNLSITPGEPTVIVGRSGLGKSTFAKIVSGLYQPNSGSLLVNDEPFHRFTPQSIRRNIAYFPQNPILFDGTIRENFLTSKKDIDENEIYRVLKSTNALEIIEKLPFGMDSEVGQKGSFFSGGEIQRIAFACFLLKNPNIMILDEPTSALDAESTSIIVNTINEIAKFRTVVVISHRTDVFGPNAKIIQLEQI